MKNIVVSNKPVAVAAAAAVALIAFVTGMIAGEFAGLWKAASAAAAPVAIGGIVMMGLSHNRKSATAKKAFDNGLYMACIAAAVMLTIHVFGTWGKMARDGGGGIVFGISLLAGGAYGMVWLFRQREHTTSETQSQQA